MTEPFLFVATGTCIVRGSARARSADAVFSRPRLSSSDRGTGGEGNH